MDVPAEIVQNIEAFHARKFASAAATPPTIWRTDGHKPGVEWATEPLTGGGSCVICGQSIPAQDLAIVKRVYMNRPYNDVLYTQYHEACARGL